MQAVVKTPRIKIEGRKIPEELIDFLRKKYGMVNVIVKEEEEMVEVTSSRWYKNIRKKISPGENIRIYREIHGWTQDELGTKLGNIPRQNISNMEKGRRPVSKEVAKKLAALFEVRIDKFIA